MRVFPSSMATSCRSGSAPSPRPVERHLPTPPARRRAGRSIMAAIVPPKRSDMPMSTSTAIEAFPGVPRAAQQARAASRGVRNETAPATPSAFPAVAGLGRVDAEALLESTPPRRGDDHGVAAPHPFHPAEIEVTRGERGPHRTRDVWPALGPIEAEPAKGAAGRTPGGKIEAELGEKPGALRRDFGPFVVEHDVFTGDQGIGEIDAESAGEVVVANSGRTEGARVTGQRAISRSLLKR